MSNLELLDKAISIIGCLYMTASENGGGINHIDEEDRINSGIEADALEYALKVLRSKHKALLSQKTKNPIPRKRGCQKLDRFTA